MPLRGEASGASDVDAGSEEEARVSEINVNFNIVTLRT